MQTKSMRVYRHGTAVVLAMAVSWGSVAAAADGAVKTPETAAVAESVRRTEVSIRGDMFFINGRPTYEGREYNGMKIEGLLMNSRKVQGIFDDLNPQTVGAWAYPDTGEWDAERNTREFVAAMPSWREYGMLSFTINLQGGFPGEGYPGARQLWHNSALRSDGSLRADYMNRLERILDRADELGMVPILGIYYFGQDERIEDEAAVMRGVQNAVNWVLAKGYRNVLIEINNECNVRYDHAILQPARVHELIELAKGITRDGRRLYVSTSYGGNTIPRENVVRASDYLLLHGNGVNDPKRIAEMVRQTRRVPGYRPVPILFNEDDHYDFEKPINNYLAAVGEYASWGYFDYRRRGEPFEAGYQAVPADWAISHPRKQGFFRLLAEMTGFCAAVSAAELSVDDFKFDGPLGSHGAQVEKLGTNHFQITLGHAPNQPTWCNMLYFQITGNAKGKQVRVDVSFPGGNAYRFNHNAATWSYDAENWQPIRWSNPDAPEKRGDSLLFPVFTEDQVWFGAQVPMSYENVVEMMDRWGRHPHARVHILGKSLGGRNLYRLEITDPQSPTPPSARWAHWIGNQHPGEHNAQWRMVGMIDWLLSDEGADCRRRTIAHFVLMTSPDGPSQGWYRVNAQGVDMNRSYFVEGAHPQKQAHEAYVVQKDLEALMASDAPVTTLWGMHTWAGLVEPILVCGPEMGTVLGPWEEFRRIIRENDPQDLIKPLAIREKPGSGTHWNNGPHLQFGITTVLCEGSGDWTCKQRSLDAGTILMKSLAQYYEGLRPGQGGEQ